MATKPKVTANEYFEELYLAPGYVSVGATLDKYSPKKETINLSLSVVNNFENRLALARIGETGSVRLTGLQGDLETAALAEHPNQTNFDEALAKSKSAGEPEEMLEDPEKPRKRRGRPPGSKKKASAKAEAKAKAKAKSEDATPAEPKKKRGRPPGSKNKKKAKAETEEGPKGETEGPKAEEPTRHKLIQVSFAIACADGRSNLYHRVDENVTEGEALINARDICQSRKQWNEKTVEIYVGNAWAGRMVLGKFRNRKPADVAGDIEGIEAAESVMLDDVDPEAEEAGEGWSGSEEEDEAKAKITFFYVVNDGEQEHEAAFIEPNAEDLLTAATDHCFDHPSIPDDASIKIYAKLGGKRKLVGRVDGLMVSEDVEAEGVAALREAIGE